MPAVIDYQAVLDQMISQRFKSLYFNSGAFGFPPEIPTHTLAWIGPADSSIRPAAQALTRPVPAPYEATLARLAARLWQEQLPGRAWIMPMSHWAFELGHGSEAWLPALVGSVGADPAQLENRNNAAAIEFSLDEIAPFERFVSGLLTHLDSSDFAIAFPGSPTLCTLHHHKQLWWTTTDDAVMDAVERLAL